MVDTRRKVRSRRMGGRVLGERIPVSNMKRAALARVALPAVREA